MAHNTATVTNMARNRRLAAGVMLAAVAVLSAGSVSGATAPETVRKILAGLDLPPARRQRLDRMLTSKEVAAFRLAYRTDVRARLLDAARAEQQTAMPKVMPTKVGPKIQAIRGKLRAGPPSDAERASIRLAMQEQTRKAMMPVVHKAADQQADKAAADERLLAWRLAQKIRAELPDEQAAALDAAVRQAGLKDTEPVYLASAKATVAAAIEAYDPDITGVIDPKTGRITGSGAAGGSPPPARLAKGRAAAAPRPAAAQKLDGDQEKLKRMAQGMIRASQRMLAPVYAPLAAQIVKDFQLAEKDGVGIDLGSGPGTLIVELCKRTRLHWVNADINPHFFPYFMRLAEAQGFGHRVSAICADAQALPFRDHYAAVIVSRGSYHFWPDQEKGFREIFRVLKRGGVAYVGLGFSRDVGVDVVRRIQAQRGGRVKQDSQKKAAQALRAIVTRLGIRDYRIHLPMSPGGEDVSYGTWIEIHKPAAKRRRGSETTDPTGSR